MQTSTAKQDTNNQRKPWITKKIKSTAFNDDFPWRIVSELVYS